MKRFLPWLLFPVLITFIFIAVYAGEMLSMAAFTALITFAIFYFTFWARKCPNGLKWFLTRTWVILPGSVLLLWTGWAILPNAGMIKLGYVLLHFLVDSFLFFEQARIDKTLSGGRRR